MRSIYRVNVRFANSDKIVYVYRYRTLDAAERFMNEFRSGTYIPELVID